MQTILQKLVEFFKDLALWQQVAAIVIAAIITGLAAFAWRILKRKRREARTIILQGNHPLPYPYDGVEVEIFYPKSFSHTPNLTISFPEKPSPPGRKIDVGCPHSPKYAVIQQRPDGFKVKILDLSFYAPTTKWRTEG